MPDILSQSQIDSLLNELSTGGIDYDSIENKKSDKKVKNYDFKNPKKVTKEELKVLNGIYDSFARHLSLYFSGILRLNCSISVASIEELPYIEYNNALPDTVLIGILDMKPFERAVLVDMSNSVTFTLIERLLGGNSTSSALDREFTEIELAVMNKIFQQIISIKKEVWSKFIEVDPYLRQIETNARFIQSLSADEVVVIIVMDVCIKSVTGTMSICIPCVNIESVLDSLINNQQYGRKKVDGIQAEHEKVTLIGNIGGSLLDISAVMGETTLTMSEILNLQPGDVVKLDQHVDSDVKVRVEGKEWFRGTPGIRKNKKVIKINDVT